MIIHVVKCHIKPGTKNQYMEIAADFVNEMSSEKGFISSDLCEIEGTDTEVAYVVKWEDEEAFSAHAAGENFKRHIPLMGEFFLGCDEDKFITV